MICRWKGDEVLEMFASAGSSSVGESEVEVMTRNAGSVEKC
jgi:hypothetical protein